MMDLQRIVRDLGNFALILEEASKVIESLPQSVLDKVRQPLCDELAGSAGMAREAAAGLAAEQQQHDAALAALKEIAEYTGEGPSTTPWQQIVRDIAATARAATENISPADTLQPSPRKKGNPMKMFQVATTGKIQIAHDLSRRIPNSNAYTVEVRDHKDEVVIGTVAHDDEMNALVGEVMADTLRQRVADGTYCHTLTPVEVMGLRGSLVERIETPGSAAEASPQAILSDDALRALWRSKGGVFHGPRIETGTMPEAQLLPFLRELMVRQDATPAMAAVSLLREYITEHGEWWQDVKSSAGANAIVLEDWLEDAMIAATPGAAKTAIKRFVALVDTGVLEWIGDEGDWEPILLADARQIIRSQEYNMNMGVAATNYINSLSPNAVGRLPANFRWHEAFNRMLTALSPSEVAQESRRAAVKPRG